MRKSITIEIRRKNERERSRWEMGRGAPSVAAERWYDDQGEIDEEWITVQQLISYGVTCPHCGAVTQHGEITPAGAFCIFQKYMGIPSCLDGRTECPWQGFL